MTTETQRIADDLLQGAGAIAEFTGLPERRIYAMTSKQKIPTFRIGGTLCARKSRLMEWFEDLESSGG